ncbi:MAG TPA: PAS domain S-box protein [Candidatus Baltobacteraceae bacterium]|nr:PAS domain S-box protein [Candidatus Baltobacteraceae bacterium]
MIGEALSVSGTLPLIQPGRSLAPGSDESFQKLLLRIAAKAGEPSDAGALIRLFCQAVREFFQVSTVSFWRHSEEGLTGEQADGKLAERVVGMRLGKERSAIVAESLRQRRALFSHSRLTHHLENASEPFAAELGIRSLLAVPIIVFNDVIGAVTFLHEADDDFFNEGVSAKATILAGQLGSLLESIRLSETSREEHRRAEILADVAHALHGTPDVSAVIEALADRLRLLLRTQLVCVLLKRDGPFELRAVSAESPQLANLARARHDRQTLRFAANLAQRAVAAGELITLSIGAEVHSLGNLACAGMLIAAPLRTSRTQGAILVYPRADGVYTPEERALVSAIAGFGAVAVAHAELYSTAHAQAHELHQLLEISSALSSSRDLDHFFQSFVVHATDFLGYGRCFIALLEDNHFQVRYALEKGEPQRVDVPFPEGVATQALRSKEVFWTDDASRVPGVNLEAITKYKVKQVLAVPLLGTSGELLGMFGVLDRADGTGIPREDIRRARALSNQVAVVLEVANNLHLSERHRRRAEALMELAREIDGALLLPEFSRRFLCRATELTGSASGLLAVLQEGRWQVVALHPQKETAAAFNEAAAASANGESRNAATRDSATGPQSHPDPAVDRNGGAGLHLPQTLADSVAHQEQVSVSGSAADLLGAEAAAYLNWTDCTLVRLAGPSGTLAGILCLSGRTTALGNVQLTNAPMTKAQEDRVFLETMANHAAMALENARLFTRIERANRHWMAIFDAITDFIVVHDQNDNVLRVNRSLAAMIGVPPAELIGVNMRALMALTSETRSYSCPFCRSMAEETDEFVHPVFDRTYLVSTSRIHGPGEEIPQTIHVLKDISDRREAERRYRELFDNIQEGLFFSTPSGRFVEVNDAMVRMLGYSNRDELLQVDIATELYFSPDQRERHSELMKEHGSLRNFEATLRRKDGSPIHVLINAFGLYDHTGQLTQIRGLMLDVTGIRTYQSELHRERDFSAKILGNTQSLILVADTAGLVSYGNRRWYDAGFEQRELLGRPLLELAAPGFVGPLADAIQRTLDGQQVDNLELQIVRGSGAAGKFSANLSPMRDEQGTITSIVAVLTDITDSAVLRDKLVHAEKMAAVGQLVSGVAHEVNNPLTAILGFADLLMENSDLPETARKDLRVILQEAQRTKQIVQNLLSFARQMPPQRNAVQLNSILRRTLQLRSYDFNSHGIEVIEHLDSELPEVLGDAHQLQQVFLNILNNAYDAVHEVGRPARIEIMSTKSGDAVEVSFCDNGNGITEPGKIFDPFFTTKEVGKGTGLGLSICYGIVKEHGGEILCHNNIGRQGATFIVRLPVTAHAGSIGVAAGVTQK